MKKRANTCPQRQQRKKARRATRRQAEKRSTLPACELFKTINHFFSDLFEQRRQIEDCRSRFDYALSEVLMAGIALFIFQQGSRNAFNNLRQEEWCCQVIFG